MAYKIVDIMEGADKYNFKDGFRVIIVSAIFLLLFYSSAIVKWAENLPVNSTSDRILSIAIEWNKVTNELKLNGLEEFISSFLDN